MTRSSFDFGSNWRSFLHFIDEEHIAESRQSLVDLLEIEDLMGQGFLDVGCGSGIFSLSARQLGASVVSFDFDPASVCCADRLKARFFPNDPDWEVMRGSILDETFCSRLGRFDQVYAWGVLHHTGAMWESMGNVIQLVRPGGKLVLSIYNDQGFKSSGWRAVKRLYNLLPRFLRLPYALGLMVPIETAKAVRAWIGLGSRTSLQRWKTNRNRRGMSRWHDWIDWIGGYPFEVASPQQIIDFCQTRGLELLKLNGCGKGSGCNEFLWTRREPPPAEHPKGPGPEEAAKPL